MNTVSALPRNQVCVTCESLKRCGGRGQGAGPVGCVFVLEALAQGSTAGFCAQSLRQKLFFLEKKTENPD